MSDKILIALQYWNQDKQQALRLARFLADIEPKHTDRADFLIVARFDSSLCLATREYMSRKFNTYTYISPKRGVGWPLGCNELWFGTMEWVYHMMNAKKIPHYKAIFTCEADGAPICADWIAQMSEEWDKANKESPVYMAGALVMPGPHINGNAMMSGDLEFLHWLIRRVGGCASGGWDYALAPQFKRWGWANIPGIRSYYNTARFTPEQYAKMIEDRLIWVHGDKSGVLVDYGKIFILK